MDVCSTCLRIGCSWTDTLVCSSQWSCVFALGSIPSWFVCAGMCWGAIQYEQEGQKLDYIYYMMIKGRSWWPLVWPEVFLFKYEKEGTAWLLIKSWGDGRKELLSLPLFLYLPFYVGGTLWLSDNQTVSTWEEPKSIPNCLHFPWKCQTNKLRFFIIVRRHSAH